ncbi:hypothetical protein [Rugosimonospora africana]|uniref:Uncharacterized protein n=1 Tax=Rugosimonospora africana TaxID=556532 RepID=A0A8J3QW55_9ACTN|nr:hypothetical protein [Rugosimonospora africana]GIH18214.1 hypothetical protein Raf01_63860 [Rugosimonospora africana]
MRPLDVYQAKTYRRVGSQGIESLKMVVHVDDRGDYEIHVTHLMDERVLTDEISFRGRDGELWLQDRHAGLIGDGFELVSPESKTI